MKKIYESPDMEIERFLLADIITVSGEEGIGSGDGEIDPWAE